MKKEPKPSLRQRVESLEEAVSGMEDTLKRIEAAVTGGAPAETATTDTPPLTAPETPAIPDPPVEPEPPASPIAAPEFAEPAAKPKSALKQPVDLSSLIANSGYWMNKVGIGLLLLGLAFLFKYSVDQGWLQPPLRVAFGLALGVTLLLLGFRLRRKNRHFGNVIAGGGIAALYLTGYAAYQLYDLVPYAVAFAFMASVTLVAFYISLQQEEVVFSLIGVAGGLFTPLILSDGSIDFPAVVVYTCVVLAGALGIFMFKGWRALLALATIGGWVTLAVFYAMLDSLAPVRADRWWLQAGVAFAMATFWVLPLIRESLRARDPAKWAYPEYDYLAAAGMQKQSSGYFAEHEENIHAHLLSLSSPLVALRLSMAIWPGSMVSDTTWGWITMGAAAAFGLAFLLLRRQDAIARLAYTQAIVGAALVALALVLLLDGDALFFALAVQATVMQLLAWRLADRGIEFSAHLLFLVLAAWLVNRLLDAPQEGTVLANPAAMAELAAIAAAAGVSLILGQRQLRLVYRWGAHIGFMALLLRELSSLSDGQAYVTIAWAAYALALLGAGLVLKKLQLRLAALVALAAVVAKLLLLDLSYLDAVWRILLFLGFGVLFLVLSYFFQSAWKLERGNDELGTPGTTA